MRGGDQTKLFVEKILVEVKKCNHGPVDRANKKKPREWFFLCMVDKM